MPEGADDQQVEAETASRRAWPRPGSHSCRGKLRLRLLPGPAFAALTAGPALLAVAWLLPGTGLLLAGRLLAAPMVIIFIPLAVVLRYFAVRHLPASWPREVQRSGAGCRPRRRSSRRASAAARPKPDVLLLAKAFAILVIAAGFVVWQAVLQSEQVFTTSDPGVRTSSTVPWIAERMDGADPGGGQRVRQGPGPWATRPPGSPYRVARSRLPCPGCRWCWPAATWLERAQMQVRRALPRPPPAAARCSRSPGWLDACAGRGGRWPANSCSAASLPEVMHVAHPVQRAPRAGAAALLAGCACSSTLLMHPAAPAGWARRASRSG